MMKEVREEEEGTPRRIPVVPTMLLQIFTLFKLFRILFIVLKATTLELPAITLLLLNMHKEEESGEREDAEKDFREGESLRVSLGVWRGGGLWNVCREDVILWAALGNISCVV